MNENSNINDIVLSVIIEKIKEKGLTEKDVLKTANISTSFLSDWKNHRISSPAFDKIYRIIKVLGIDFNSLLGYDNNSIVTLPDDFPVDEKILLDTYRELDQNGKSFLQKKLREIWKNNHLNS